MALGDGYLDLKREEEAEREFLAAAASFDRLKTPSPNDLYNVAGAYTRLAEFAGRRGDRARPEAQSEARRHADRAIGYLRRSFLGGHRYLSAFRDSPALRERPDFQQLLRDSEFPDEPFAP